MDQTIAGIANALGMTPQTLKVLVLAWIVSNLVSTMPTPNCTGFLGSALYKWIFNFTHAVMGNAGRIARGKLTAILGDDKGGQA